MRTQQIAQRLHQMAMSPASEAEADRNRLAALRRELKDPAFLLPAESLTREQRITLRDRLERIAREIQEIELRGLA